MSRRLDEPEEPEAEGWHVAFTPAEHPRHCLLFRYDVRGERWVIIDPRLRGDAILVLASQRFDRWLAWLQPRACIVRLADGRRPQATIGWGVWCVARVKQVLGWRSGAFTPAQLQREMLRQGVRWASET